LAIETGVGEVDRDSLQVHKFTLRFAERPNSPKTLPNGAKKNRRASQGGPAIYFRQVA
jgi:hypothetical protein